MTTTLDGWRAVNSKGEYVRDLPCGLRVIVYRHIDDDGWCFRVGGWNNPSQKLTGGTLPEAKRWALRGVSLLLEVAVDQLSAALIDCGTGMH